MQLPQTNMYTELKKIFYFATFSNDIFVKIDFSANKRNEVEEKIYITNWFCKLLH
jgi:hypothetical protein